LHLAHRVASFVVHFPCPFFSSSTFFFNTKAISTAQGELTFENMAAFGRAVLEHNCKQLWLASSFAFVLFLLYKQAQRQQQRRRPNGTEIYVSEIRKFCEEVEVMKNQQMQN
jgi:hypothetical protein